MKFFKAGEEGRDVPNFLDEVRYLVVDNDSRSLAFSSRRIERLAKIEEAFCSIFARWNIDAEDQRKLFEKNETRFCFLERWRRDRSRWTKFAKD